MTYNTQALCVGDKQKAKQLLKYVNQQDADVVCLQEVKVYKNASRLTLNDLRQSMKDYPYTYYDFKVYNSRIQFGNVVFSRYPLFNKHTISYQSKSNISSCCDMAVEDDTIRLIVNHLESYKFTHRDLQLDSVSDIKTRSLNDKIKTAGLLRHKQARAVKQEIKQSPYPVLAVGDFNAIPLSYVYWKIRWGMRDCFLEGSFGQIGNTFKYRGLGLRIDYILCSRTLHPIKSEVGRATHSDHFPIISTIAW